MSAPCKAKFRIPYEIIKDEYQYHQNTELFNDLESFRRYISKQTYTHLEHTPSNNRSIIIRYNLYRNNSKVCGIFERDKTKLLWVLTKFIKQSQIAKNKKRKQYKKSKKKIKAKKSGLSYDPKQYEKSTTEITKTMTQTVIPNQVNEINIDDHYHYMIKSIALGPIITANDSTMRIFNFQFTDKNSGKRLFCVADKLFDKSSWKWKLRSQLYTAQHIIKLTKLTEKELPFTIRDTPDFKQKLNDIITMEKMLNDPQIRANVFNTKVAWQNIAVFTNDRAANKTEYKITKPKDIFVSECNCILNGKEIVLVPILLFNHNIEPNWNIQGLMRLTMAGNDIGISFEYKNGNIYPGAVHLNESMTKAMHHLAVPNTCQNAFFDGWETNINGFFVGTKDFFENKFKAKTIECKTKTDALVDIVSILGNLNIDNKQLTRAIERAKKVMPSMGNENDTISAMNDDIKYDVVKPNDSNNIHGTIVFYPKMGSPVVTSGMMVAATPVQIKQQMNNMINSSSTQPSYQQCTDSTQYSASTLDVNAAEFVPESKLSNGLNAIPENAEIPNCV